MMHHISHSSFFSMILYNSIEHETNVKNKKIADVKLSKLWYAPPSSFRKPGFNPNPSNRRYTQYANVASQLRIYTPIHSDHIYS